VAFLIGLFDGIGGYLICAPAPSAEAPSNYRQLAGWSSTVFAHELPPRSAGFDAENRLYLFALTLPSEGYARERAKKGRE